MRTWIRSLALCLAAGVSVEAQTAKDGWQSLFDGHTLSGWHALGFSRIPPGGVQRAVVDLVESIAPPQTRVGS